MASLKPLPTFVAYMNNPRLGLAIATYRQDDLVCALLDKVYTECPELFESIIIVDSHSSGAVESHIDNNTYEKVVFQNSTENMGSAGNLALRLEIAADLGLDFVYAINHDGTVDHQTVEALLAYASTHERIGAAYPLRYLEGRDSFDYTGTQRLPLPFRGKKGAATEEPISVYWASSNGALYNLEPVREGLLPWRDLWMGWEDMGYGWLLDKNGWKQCLVPGTQFSDNYECIDHQLFGKTVTITDKPAWYAYYGTRNLILVVRRNERPSSEFLVVAARVALEVGLTAVFKQDKAQRLKYIAAGIYDGIRERTGKWHVP